MLQRLAAMGVVTDAATSDDFSGVRALPGWTEFEASSAYKKASGLRRPRGDDALHRRSRADSGRGSESRDVEAEAATTARVEGPKPNQRSSRKTKPGAVGLSRRQKRVPPRPLIFSASGLAAVGLGYDAVSGRFIVGDRKDRRLLVVGERSGRLASLAGVDAGFDEVSAFEIDAVEGDLWVVSSSSQSRSSTLHKLQLISGRVLTSIPLPTDERPEPFHRRRGHAAEHSGARRRRPAGLSRRQKGANARDGRAARRIRVHESRARG